MNHDDNEGNEGKKKNLEPNNILLDFVHLTHTRIHVQRVFRYFTASFSPLFLSRYGIFCLAFFFLHHWFAYI